MVAVEVADLENEIGRETVPAKDKMISEDDCLELCNLFNQLQTKANQLWRNCLHNLFHQVMMKSQ